MASWYGSFIIWQVEDERLMLRAVTLLSKALLHHLQPLLTLPRRVRVGK